MNILIIERELNPATGGVQRVSYVLGEEFIRQGHSVYYAYTVKKSDIDIIPVSNKLYIGDILEDESLSKTLSNFCATKNIGFVVNQNVNSSLLRKVLLDCKKRYGVKIVYCLHANPDMTSNKNILKLTPINIYIKDLIKDIVRKVKGDNFIQNLRRNYAICDGYLLLSDRYKSVFEYVTGIANPDKLYGIPNPCTFDDNDDINFEDKENVIIMVGRLAEGQKRISNILRIWRKLFNILPDWKLVIVGGGDDLDNYISWVERNNLPRVNFIGPSNNVAQYYKKAKVFIMTSVWEGLPMTLIEGQQYGCVPVVFDNFAAVHDVITDGYNGYIINSRDGLNEIAFKIQMLANDGVLLASMSDNARTSVRLNFDKKKIIDMWCNFIEKLNIKNEI